MNVFIINKIRLIVIAGLIVCICGIMIASIGTAIQTNATPATNKTVVLDAGHGVPDEGNLLLH